MNKKGFTLIELMVSITIFSIVMLISVGALLSIIDANRKAQSLKSVMNNLNFALENMSRNIRVGTNYHCKPYDGVIPPSVPSNITTTSDCSGADGGVLFAYESSKGDRNNVNDQIVYRLNGTHIERSLDSGGTFTAITAPEVNISNFRFYVVGSSPLTSGDTIQPRVIMTIQGFAGVGSNQTQFNVQASVSQRLIDI